MGKMHFTKRQKGLTLRRFELIFRESRHKNSFLTTFRDCFDDGVVRKMVLEVNSRNGDLESIINDLTGVGINFV